MKRKICCICIVLFFIICILGSRQAETVFINRTVSAQSGEETQAHAAMLLPVDLLQKMDDFHVVSGTSGNSSGVFQGLRQAAHLFFAALVILFFGIVSLVRRYYLPDKPISVFLVVTFIHRTDGKKKSCFDL